MATSRAGRPLVQPQDRLVRRLVAVLALGLLGIAWFTAALQLEQHWTPNSDEAWQSLAAADLVSGNWRLAGWTLSPFTTWTSELLFYAAAIKVIGLSPALLTTVPVVIYGLVMVLAAWLAGFGLPARESWLARAAVVLLLALPTPFQATITFRPGTPHFGTALGSMTAFGLAAVAWRSRRPLVPLLGAGLALCAASAGDGLVAPVGLVPMALATLLVGWRTTAWRPTVWVLITVLAAGALSEAARRLPSHIGGFTYVAFSVQRVSRAELPHSLSVVWTSLQGLLGSDALGAAPIAGYAAAAAAAVIALAIAGALLPLVWRRTGEADWLDVVMAISIVGDISALALTDRALSTQAARYLTPALVLGFALSARKAVRLRGHWRALAAAAATGLALFHAFAAVQLLTAPPAPAPTAKVDDWLLAHGYTRGYAGWWDADLMTVQSRGRVEVRPVLGGGGVIGEHHYLSKDAWYRDSPRGRSTTFLVIRDDPAVPPADLAALNFGLSEDLAVRFFGPPAGQVSMYGYRVLYWNSDISTRLAR